VALSIEEIIAVQNVAVRMYHAGDGENARGYADLYSEDGTLDGPFGKAEGRDAVFAWMDDYVSQGHEAGVRHFITNMLVEDHAEGARLRCYVMKMNVAEGPSFIGTGDLDILMVREGSDWKIKYNKITIDPALLKKKA